MLVQPYKTDWRKIHELNKVGFSMKYFTDHFLDFVAQMSEIPLLVTGWELLINSKFFRDFLEVSLLPKILNLTSFGNLWANYLVIII